MLNFSNFILLHTQNGDFSGNCNCRMANYIGGRCRCFVKKTPLQLYHRQQHHRLPKFYGGGDNQENLIMLTDSVHHLIHAYKEREIGKWMKIVKPTKKELKIINQLRYEARQSEIVL